MPLCRVRRYLESATLRLAGLAAIMTVLVVVAAPQLVAASDSRAPIQSVLDITIDPPSARLSGTATITLPAPAADTAVFRLAPGAVISQVTINDRPATHRFLGGRLAVTGLTASGKGADPFRVTIVYSAIFNDPVPEMPVNTDNPGYGVTGTIGGDGVFLMGGAGWYPAMDTPAPQVIRLTVSGPEGLLAVTAGRRVGHFTEGGLTRSSWEVAAPVAPLSLSAAYYQVSESQAAGVTLYTYLLAQSANLANTYLAASRRFIELYQSRFGPYPFEKFAVVENFFPTGYGFPSYTLMGTRVLRLPFIPYSSLGHEIAHCWWGNGVLVDPDAGNWSEGLTSYVADYLYKELEGPEEARDYRRQWLRNYATLVPPEVDFPLSQFRSRTDPATKVIGYDKGAMVFHMLRKQVGDTAFWEALRRFYMTMRFRKASWDDIRKTFERISGQHLGGFFNQWVHQAGAPSFTFGAVAVHPAETGFRVDGRILQPGAPYGVTMDMTILTEQARFPQSVPVAGPETLFEAVMPYRPGKIVLDPGANVFRRLEWAEVPPTVNSVKASADLLVVVATAWAAEKNKDVAQLLASLGLRHYTVTDESQVGAVGIAGKDLLFFGPPSRQQLLSIVPETITLAPGRFTVDGEAFGQPEDALFCVFQHPVTEGKTAALFFPLSSGAAASAIRKITHYGRYSFLVFSNGDNRLKAVWPIISSPMEYFFPLPDDDEKQGA